MVDRIEILKNTAKEHYNKKNYKKCTKAIYKLLEAIDLSDKNNAWFGYTYLLGCYKNMGKYNLAIRYGKKAITYIEQNERWKYYQNSWFIGRCYQEIGLKTQKTKALQIFNQCITYYTLIENNFLLAEVISNKALILNSVELMEGAIQLYIQTKDISDEKLDNAYKNLHKIYVDNNLNIKAYSVISKIKDKQLQMDLKNQLSKKLLAI